MNLNDANMNENASVQRLHPELNGGQNLAALMDLMDKRLSAPEPQQQPQQPLAIVQQPLVSQPLSQPLVLPAQQSTQERYSEWEEHGYKYRCSIPSGNVEKYASIDMSPNEADDNEILLVVDDIEFPLSNLTDPNSLLRRKLSDGKNCKFKQMAWVQIKRRK